MVKKTYEVFVVFKEVTRDVQIQYIPGIQSGYEVAP